MEFKKDELLVKVFETRDEMGKDAAKDVAECMRKLLLEKDEINMIFAAAPSQNDMLLHLLSEEGIDWERVNTIKEEWKRESLNFIKKYL